jgi:SAM-dependent methyltransferase
MGVQAGNDRLRFAACLYGGFFMVTGFAEILNSLNLPAHPAILDVGAGGFTGETTTIHLVKVPGARIDAIELVPERAQRLADKFTGKVNVINGDFLQHRFERVYDLVVLDLDSQIIPALYESWLFGKVKEILKPTGTVIVLCFGYAPPGPTPDFGLADEVQVLAKDFLARYFGAQQLTPKVVAATFDRNADYRFLSMIGKQRKPPPETIVWIALQRR